jgi:transcriptional regulator with XRE-family HTH domain
MAERKINHVLAENLRRLMEAGGWSALRLGNKAEIAPNTIGNYLKPDGEFTSTGKQRSAKLTEVERLAEALGVSVQDLLRDDAPAPAPKLSATAIRLAECFDSLPLGTPALEDAAELKYWRAVAVLRGEISAPAGRPLPQLHELPNSEQTR